MTPRIPAAAAAALLVLLLAACSGAPADRDTPSPKPSETASEPTVAPVATDAPDADEPLTCESLISAGTVEALTAAGWTAKPVDFVIGDLTLTDGLLCLWGDFTVASDHGQLYGWSEIDGAAAADAQAALISEGWLREDGPEGVYITEDPQFSMGTDEDGYGMTYLFGDGWVKFSDTRQGLVLISGRG